MALDNQLANQFGAAVSDARFVGDNAEKKYGELRSTHEAYGVLAEEFGELLDAIRSNDVNAIRAEAVDVAAVAIRLATACEKCYHDLSSEFASRSGF